MTPSKKDKLYGKIMIRIGMVNESWGSVLEKFILQAHSKDLKTSYYSKEWNGLRLRVSFGMGVPARVPWIAFLGPDMEVSYGFYPVYLYYKELNTLILAYGVSETEEFKATWPTEVLNSTQTVADHLGVNIPRYGDSFVFKLYKVQINGSKIEYVYTNTNQKASEKDIEADLNTLLNYYIKILSLSTNASESEYNSNLFNVERQLEDFLIDNWDKTDLGKKYNLIIEDGELMSRQYRTDVGIIDILAKDKQTDSYVVIELKRGQTSDDTVGQIARYMGWIREKKGDKNVMGIIIAGSDDERLNYALKIVPNVKLFLYEVDFKLRESGGV